jgi:hypothetical protein
MADSLVQLSNQLTRIIVPMIIIVGVVGNSLNIAILTRPALYYHACSRYFLALAGNNLFYSSVIFIYRLFDAQYHLTVSDNSTIACKIITYISTLSAFLCPYFIVFASIDRYWASSINAGIRKLSCARTAKWIILLVVTVFALLFINVLVMVDIQRVSGSSCILRADTIYGQVYAVTQVFLFAIVPPGLMILFGLMTIHNANQSRITLVTVSRFHRTERQLARMLFLQVSVHILLTLPSSTTYLMSILPNTIRTTILFSFISTIFQLLFNCSYVTSFFLYILSGHIYKKELLRLVYRIFRIRRDNKIQVAEKQTTILP